MIFAVHRSLMTRMPSNVFCERYPPQGPKTHYQWVVQKSGKHECRRLSSCSLRRSVWTWVQVGHQTGYHRWFLHHRTHGETPGLSEHFLLDRSCRCKSTLRWLMLVVGAMQRHHMESKPAPKPPWLCHVHRRRQQIECPAKWFNHHA